MKTKVYSLALTTMLLMLFATAPVFTSCKNEVSSQTDFPTSASSNSTQVGGIINSNTTWTLENSPYILVDDITVAKGATLTIEPGVEVNFDLWSLIIEGTLIAKGNESHRIKLQSSEKPLRSHWPRIGFSESSTQWNETTETGCIIEYAEIDIINYQYETIRGGFPKISNSIIFNYAIDAAAIYVNGGLISNNTIVGGYRGIATERSDGPLISYNIIEKTGRGGAICIGFDTAPEIVGNLLIDNYEGITVWNPRGFYITNNTITRNAVGFRFTSYISASSLEEIVYNNIFGNDYDVLVEKEDPRITINMTHNWWGTTNTSLIDQKIYDQKDNRRLCPLNYTPFLSEPHFANTPKFSSSISCSVSRFDLTLGESITVSGFIDPQVSNANVTLTYTKPDWSILNRTVTSAADGSYRDTFTPDSVGLWNVKASLKGDLIYEGASSSFFSFYVAAYLEAHCVDGDNENLPGLTVKLYNSTGHLIQTRNTNSTGWVKFTSLLPSQIYSFKAYWMGIKVLDENLTLTREGQTDNIQCAVHDLVVHVVNGRGGGLPNTVVTLLWLNGTKIDSKTTNSSGHVVFENLPSSTYHVKASLEGYREKSVETTLTREDQTETVTLQSIPFIESPTVIATISGGIIVAITATIFIILRRRKT